MRERIIETSQLEEGMLISADVYIRGGRIIIPENTKVTPGVFDLLAKHSIMEVIIAEEGEDESETDAQEPVVTKTESEIKQEEFEQIFHTAEEKLAQYMNTLAIEDKEVDVYDLLELVDAIAAKADNDVNLCDMLFKMNNSAPSLYRHSINVSIYGQLLAKWMDFNDEDIDLVGIAGLLHDIGLLKCQQEGETHIYFHDEFENKAGENHMLHGYNIIKNKDMDVKVKQAVLTHHERMDLSGFPHQLSYKNLNNISRIVAIVDAYDTLIMKEEGREAMAPLAALGHLHDNYYIKLDSELLVRFIRKLVQNFIQYEVLLSNGQRGKIVMPNKIEVARPLVMVEGGFVDLALRKDLTIKEMFY